MTPIIFCHVFNCYFMFTTLSLHVVPEKGVLFRLIPRPVGTLVNIIILPFPKGTLNTSRFDLQTKRHKMLDLRTTHNTGQARTINMYNLDGGLCFYLEFMDAKQCFRHLPPPPNIGLIYSYEQKAR